MARQYIAPPQYIQTLANNGQGGPSLSQQANYNAAVGQKYNNGQPMLTAQGQGGYSPQELSEYARQEQERYQGGPAVDSAQLGQAAADAAQRNNLQAVGAQRGAGGQAQGLRAAMMGTNNQAAQQSQAQVQAGQEQVAQRAAIMQQRMQSEQANLQAKQNWQQEKDRFQKEKDENDADTQSGIFQMASNAFSDERAKNVKSGRSKAPSLVIMLGKGYC